MDNDIPWCFNGPRGRLVAADLHFRTALSQSGEISPDFCCFYRGGIRHNEDIMHSFQNFIVRLISNHPPPLETTIWELVVRALLSEDQLESKTKEDGTKWASLLYAIINWNCWHLAQRGQDFSGGAGVGIADQLYQVVRKTHVG